MVPLHSMTGYGTASRHWQSDDGPRSLDVELRSVNARFLELKVRQPFGAAAEPEIRRQLEAGLGRGRVEVSLHVRTAAAAEDARPDPLAALGVDASRVFTVLDAAAKVGALAQGKLEVLPPTALEILRFCQGSSKGGPAHAEAPVRPPPCLAETIGEALDALLGFRRTEGEALATALTDLATEFEARVQALAATLEPEADRLAARVTRRIDDLRARLGADAVDPERVAQEAAMVVARGDIAEELARIASHLQQMREVLQAPAQAGQGKTLEFVAQELLREITTIGSKITSHEGSRIVIEAKGSLERIREQVHNVE